MSLKNSRLADHVFQFLADKDIDHGYLLPGGGAMHLVDAIGLNKKIKVIPCHHEQACGISAEAHGRISGTPGLAVVTTGPGSTNILTPVAGAWIESVPMIIISGQAKRSDLIGQTGVRQMGVQEVDVVSMAKPVTKYAVTVMAPDKIKYHLEKAYHLAMTGRKGPVWIDIPLDVQAAPIDWAALEGFEEKTETTSFDLNLDELTQALKTAKRPLFLAGHGIRLGNSKEAFLKTIENLNMPVVSTWNASDMLGYEDPLNIGKVGSVGLRGPNFAIQNCDLLISVGARLDFVVTAYNNKAYARNAKRFVVDIDKAELDKLEHENTTLIQSDAQSFLEQLSQIDFKFEGKEWLSKCQNWKKQYPINDGKPFDKKGPISSYQFADRLSDHLQENQLIVTGSSGLAIEAFYIAFRNKTGQRLMLTSGLGAMGYGLSAGIGGCLAHGSKPTLCIESDGSLQLNLQELSTLYELQLPLCVFILNNNGYASIRNTQRNYFEGRFVATGEEAGLHIPDICKIAEAIRIPSLTINGVENLEQGIHEALAAKGPVICNVMLIENETLLPKVAALPQEDGSMLSMPIEDMSPLLPLEELKENMMVPLHPASLKARDMD